MITGFGRLGTWTAAEYFGVTPDILNFAKQVTNGAIPLGGVVASHEIYSAFMQQDLPEHAIDLPTAIPIRHIRLLVLPL